jgi:hypothetical protein
MEWQQEEIESQSQLVEFVRVVKTGLKMGLSTLSLQLVDLELYHRSQVILADTDSEAWILRCIVKNPLTSSIKETRTQFQGTIGDTDVASVRPMVEKIVDEFRKAFYGYSA